LTQISGSSAFYDSSLAEFESSTVQPAIGFAFAAEDSPWTAKFSLVEDLWLAATPDFAIQLEIGRTLGSR
jgi:hypothetical protein|tara:strand:+ start:1101 stop:1310 length:210 start_codon:yes stop_codon:yes gene_type:complete